MALAIVGRGASTYSDEHLDQCMESIRARVGAPEDRAPRAKTCPECKGRGGYDTRNRDALYSPPYEPGEWHTCGTCRGTGSVALKLNAAGRTPEEERASRIKAGCCPECGCGDSSGLQAHYSDCSRK